MSYSSVQPLALILAAALYTLTADFSCAQEKSADANFSSSVAAPQSTAFVNPPAAAQAKDAVAFSTTHPKFAVSLNTGLAIEQMAKYDLSGVIVPRDVLLPENAPPLVTLPYVDSLFADDKNHQAGLILPFLCLQSKALAHLEAESSLGNNGKSAAQTFLEQRSHAASAAALADIPQADVPGYDPQAGAAWLELPEVYLRHGFVNELSALPRNGYKINLQATALRTLLQNLALYSNTDARGFKLPATPFDQHIYARFAKRMVKGDAFAALGQGCSLTQEDNCGLYFVGDAVSALLQDAGKDSPFYIADGMYGIPLRFDENAQPQLVLRSALSSDSNFVNYGNLLELELAVLQDLGYVINPRTHYGQSIYSFGTVSEPRKRQLNMRYAALDRQGRYSRAPASAPMGVGLHVYGSYNDLYASGSIITSGRGSIGVRLDGSGNRLILPYLTLIMADDAQGTALAVSGGRDNVLSLEGRLHAPGKEGVALLASFGSDIYSTLTEKQGSWQRVRSVRSEDGPRSTHLPMPGALQGPLCRKVNISGMLEGGKAAIWADETAFIRELNLNGQALIRGDIRIDWHPQRIEPKNGLAYWQALPSDEATGFAGARLEVPEDTPQERLQPHLQLGLDKAAAAAGGTSERIGDPNAQVRISGSVLAPFARLEQVGGRAEINGALKVYALLQEQGLLRLNLPQDTPAEVNELQLGARAVLDLVNGRADTLQVGSGYFKRSASVRVDAAPNGTILDTLSFAHGTQSSSGYLVLEPAVSYEVLKSLAADPKRFLDFMSNFTSSANVLFSREDLYIAFPERIWDNGGTYGREVTCSARGCRIGDFVRSYEQHQQEIAPWRYMLSAGGLAALLALTYLYFSLPWLKLKLRKLLRRI